LSTWYVARCYARCDIDQLGIVVAGNATINLSAAMKANDAALAAAKAKGMQLINQD
jgi:hypothetical protein